MERQHIKHESCRLQVGGHTFLPVWFLSPEEVAEALSQAQGSAESSLDVTCVREQFGRRETGRFGSVGQKC